MDNDTEKKQCCCCRSGKGTPWVSIVIVTLCLVWIVGRLIYFYQGNGNTEQKTGSECQSVKQEEKPAQINGLLASDLSVLKAKNVSEAAFTNAFKRLSDRRRELAAQQTALEFDYKNWLNSWSVTNRTIQTKIARFRSLSKQDQNDPEVAAKLAKVSASLRKVVGEDPVGSSLLSRCDALIPETEAVEKLYIECVKAMAAAKGKIVPASQEAENRAEQSVPANIDLSTLKAGPVSEPVSLAAPAAISTNTTSEVKAEEPSPSETKELKE